MDRPASAAEAIAVQERLRGLVEVADTGKPPQNIAGLDVAYDGDRLAAAVVVVDAATLREVDRAVIEVPVAGNDTARGPRLPGRSAGALTRWGDNRYLLANR